MAASSSALSGFAVASTSRTLISVAVLGGLGRRTAFRRRRSRATSAWTCEDLADPELGEGEHLVELVAGERQALGGALHLDEAPR